ncbi:Ribosomal RNA small subunit methyltransferase I [Streptomyces violarus]
MTGTLVLAGTPIGDIADAPPRLAEELAGADVVAAKDTRRLRRLTQALGVTPKGRVVLIPRSPSDTARPWSSTTATPTPTSCAC